MEMIVPVLCVMKERSEGAAPVVSRMKSIDPGGMDVVREVVV